MRKIELKKGNNMMKFLFAYRKHEQLSVSVSRDGIKIVEARPTRVLEFD